MYIIKSLVSTASLTLAINDKCSQLSGISSSLAPCPVLYPDPPATEQHLAVAEPTLQQQQQKLNAAFTLSWLLEPAQCGCAGKWSVTSEWWSCVSQSQSVFLIVNESVMILMVSHVWILTNKEDVDTMTMILMQSDEWHDNHGSEWRQDVSNISHTS